MTFICHTVWGCSPWVYPGTVLHSRVPQAHMGRGQAYINKTKQNKLQSYQQELKEQQVHRAEQGLPLQRSSLGCKVWSTHPPPFSPWGSQPPFSLPVILPICNFGLFRYNLKLISEDLYGILNKKLYKKFFLVLHFACCNRQKSPVLLMNMLVLSKQYTISYVL